MVETNQSSEAQQKGQPASGSVAETSIKQETVPKETNLTGSTHQANGNQKPAEPVSVRLIDDGGLKPFEEQTLAIARETLILSRRAYWIAIFGFLAAVAAAIFVGTQVQIMSYQTHIMGSQSESAAAGAAVEELNTRNQISVARQQAKAAQDSITAIHDQMQLDQRAWVGLKKITINLKAGQRMLVETAVINTGKTPALSVTHTGIVHMSKTEIDVDK